MPWSLKVSIHLWLVRRGKKCCSYFIRQFSPVCLCAHRVVCPALNALYHHHYRIVVFMQPNCFASFGTSYLLTHNSVYLFTLLPMETQPGHVAVMTLDIFTAPNIVPRVCIFPHVFSCGQIHLSAWLSAVKDRIYRLIILFRIIMMQL